MRELEFRAYSRFTNNFVFLKLPTEPESYEFFYDEASSVIEQYTGLKDKNGKEIYEGDIVKAKIQGIWETGPDTVCRGKAVWNLEVVYNEIRYMDVFHILGSKNSPDRIYYLFEDRLSEIEVIGNIHENPELLEAKAYITE